MFHLVIADVEIYHLLIHVPRQKDIFTTVGMLLLFLIGGGIITRLLETSSIWTFELEFVVTLLMYSNIDHIHYCPEDSVQRLSASQISRPVVMGLK